MTTIAHNPVTDGPLVMSFEDAVTGDPETFAAVQIRIQTAAACIPVDGVLVATEDGPIYTFDLPDDLPARALLTDIYTNDGGGLSPSGNFVLKIVRAC